MLWKCYIQYASKFGKQQWPQDWKRSFFIPIPKKGNAKEFSNYHTIALISHASKVMLKILQARLHQYVNHEFPDIQGGFRKGRGTRDPTSIGSSKKQEFQKNIYFCFIDYAKAFDCVDHNKLGKFWKRWEYQTFLLRNLYADPEKQLELDIQQQTSSKLGKEYVKAVYCHPAFLTYMQSTSCKMLGWMKHKLESRLLGEISITSDTQITPPLWQKAEKNWRASWWKWKRRVKKLA